MMDKIIDDVPELPVSPHATHFERIVFRTELLATIAFKKWGKNAQIIKAIEEFAEVTQVLAKTLNGNPHVSADQLIDEVADATIMAFQLRLMTSPSEVDRRIEYKLNRLAAALAKPQ
jgi:hypothetical protein